MFDYTIKKIWLLLILSCGLIGCVTKSVYKDLVMVDKDKAECFVYMAADYDFYDNPVIDFSQARDSAAQQCKSWLYKGATPLEGYDLTCIVGTEDDCERYKVVYTYQCLTAQDIKDYDAGVFKLKTKKPNTKHTKT